MPALFNTAGRNAGHLLALALLIHTIAPAQSTQRNGLAEEFSASTCHPCKYFGDEYHPACVAIGVNDTGNHVNAISYQMDYPSPGDLSYNLHAKQRYDYYFILGLPHLKVNGKGIATNLMQPALYTSLDTSRTAAAKFKITGTYEINTQTQQITTTVNVLPLASGTGKFRVHLAVTERHYNNYTDTADVPMPDYYYVMRRMFPDGNGKRETTWTANVTKTYTYSAPYQVSNPPAMGSYDFWGNPMNTDLIAFVQDSTSKRILQSKLIKPTLKQQPNGLEENNNALHAYCYPNPAANHLYVELNSDAARSLGLRIHDLNGRCVYSRSQNVRPGGQLLEIDVDRLAPGLYSLCLDDGTLGLTRKFVVAER